MYDRTFLQRSFFAAAAAVFQPLDGIYTVLPKVCKGRSDAVADDAALTAAAG